MHRESGYECYKERGGVEMSARKAIGIHLYGAARTAVITGLVRAVTLGGQNTLIRWRLTFIWFFLICSRFKRRLPAAVAWCTDSIVYLHGHSCIMYGRRLHAPIWSILNRIQCYCVVRAS